MIEFARSGLPRRYVAGVVLTCAALFLAIMSPGTPVTAQAEQSNTVMATFVIIFRQGADVLSESDRRRLRDESVMWARDPNVEGRELEPRALGVDRVHLATERSAEEYDARPITALLFLKAHDLNDAAKVGETHPAVRYGFDVEIRPWAVPGQ